MDMNIVVGSLILILFGIVIFWLQKRYKEKIKAIAKELYFFKKEKEYYDEAMMVLSENFDIIFANGATKKLFSLEEENKIPVNANKIELKIDTKDPRDFFEVLKEQIAAHKENFHLQNVLLVISGKMKQVNIYVDKSQWNIDKSTTCIIDMQRVIPAEAKTTNKDGGIDFLTGLPSQFVALTDINTLAIETQKNSRSFTLFLLGIDHFTELQATLGHDYTNKIIKRTAKYLTDNLKDEFKVYRMDCDKFLLVVNNEPSEDKARDIAKKLIIDLNYFHKEENNIHLSASIGAVKYPNDGENAAKLVNHLYIALNDAQKESDSNIEFYTTEFQPMHKDEAKINEEIQAGLKNHEFFLYYQPIFNLKTEEMIGAEALLRWKHPELGVITADKFLNVAEKTGLIVDIGEYVFREAIKQRKLWDDNGLKKFKTTLNLSLKEMHVDKLIQKLEILFEDHSVDPRDFNLDIRESTAMSNIEQTMEDFKRFKELGLSIAIDHFGASVSSLKHLQMLPLSMIKIDRSLIFDMYSNLDHQITVKAMIALIHGLGFEVVAEGVETSKESGLLYDFGCDHAQGYLFSKPLPAAEFQELLR
ncbi:diguanylate cyclase/phosphodiesterase (GGDEF & EAL domains) with PAS/PAC sensor(s) [hydrothermal vent metagenome]|uniref:Diguanylate cyclase/phosphodiesterase (GGDEF & EAL domains) with PAS/PAC sensor(S) n=1 Tax=hydrothermal vent metagenome TaxID=652676 RepID=A0A1W1BK11_9ZZZZ